MDWRRCDTPTTPVWLDQFFDVFAPWRNGKTISPEVLVEREGEAALLFGKFAFPSSEGRDGGGCKPLGYVTRFDLGLLHQAGELVADWPTRFTERVVALCDASPEALSKFIRRGSRIGLTALSNEAKKAVNEAKEAVNELRRRTLANCALDQMQGPITSIKELVELTGFTDKTIHKFIATGAIDAVMTDRGSGRVRKKIFVSVEESQRLRELHRSTLKLAQAAERIGCSTLHLNVLARAGAIPFINGTRGSIGWRFLPSDIDRLLARMVALAIPECIVKSQLKALGDITPLNNSGHPTRAWVSYMGRIMAGEIAMYRLADRLPGFTALAVRVDNLPVPGRPLVLQP
ncbi:MAG: hypothetical protein PHY45_09045 [Rhodocyclaceae bacterium]|nr:hypothetical protein [Rhodocyclaceae bacterium]